MPNNDGNCRCQWQVLSETKNAHGSGSRCFLTAFKNITLGYTLDLFNDKIGICSMSGICCSYQFVVSNGR